jgi:hypothetical protein
MRRITRSQRTRVDRLPEAAAEVAKADGLRYASHSGMGKLIASRYRDSENRPAFRHRGQETAVTSAYRAILNICDLDLWGSISTKGPQLLGTETTKGESPDTTFPF